MEALEKNQGGRVHEVLTLIEGVCFCFQCLILEFLEVEFFRANFFVWRHFKKVKSSDLKIVQPLTTTAQREQNFER